MSAATIVFCDIVGFSRKKLEDQINAIKSLNVVVNQQLKPYKKKIFRSAKVIALPTGDGIAIALLHGSNLWDKSLFMLINQLMIWRKDNRLDLRVGVHTGAVHQMLDINKRLNISGDTINLCQRVMDAANPNQVLFSEVAYQFYVGKEDNKIVDKPFSDEKPAIFEGPYNIVVKHDVQINVHSMHIGETDNDWWDNNFPASKDEVKVSLTKLPKKIGGPFSKNLLEAKQIALVQLTGENLLAKFQANELVLSENLQSLWIFMPHPEAIENSDVYPLPIIGVIDKLLEEWKLCIVRLKENHPNADIRLRVFREPPYFGGSFLDWRRKDGVIHISPYIWGVSAPNCPGFDMAWVGAEPSPVYEAYCEGLDKLIEISTDA